MPPPTRSAIPVHFAAARTQPLVSSRDHFSRPGACSVTLPHGHSLISLASWEIDGKGSLVPYPSLNCPWPSMTVIAASRCIVISDFTPYTRRLLHLPNCIRSPFKHVRPVHIPDSFQHLPRHIRKRDRQTGGLQGEAPSCATCSRPDYPTPSITFPNQQTTLPCGCAGVQGSRGPGRPSSNALPTHTTLDLCAAAGTPCACLSSTFRYPSVFPMTW